MKMQGNPQNNHQGALTHLVSQFEARDQSPETEQKRGNFKTHQNVILLQTKPQTSRLP